MSNIKDFTVKSAIGLIVALGGYWGAEKIHLTDAERVERSEQDKRDGERQAVFRQASSYFYSSVDSMISARSGYYFAHDIPRLTNEFNAKFSTANIKVSANIEDAYRDDKGNLTGIEANIYVTDIRGGESRDDRTFKVKGTMFVK